MYFPIFSYKALFLKEIINTSVLNSTCTIVLHIKFGHSFNKLHQYLFDQTNTMRLLT